MGPGSGLYHLDSSNGDHQTGDLGLLGVHGKMAENVVCCLMARITLTGRKTKSRWKQAGFWPFCCFTTFLLQGEHRHCFYILCTCFISTQGTVHRDLSWSKVQRKYIVVDLYF